MSTEEPKSGRSLKQAVVTALILLFLIIGAYLIGTTAFFWLAVIVVNLALYELLDLVARGGRRPVVPFGVICGIGAMAASYFRPEEPGYILVVLFVLTFGSLLLGLRSSRGISPATDVAWQVLSVAWVGGAGAAAVGLLTLESGLDLLVAHVLITAGGDIAAYFTGTTFGRRKLAPSVSPSKSWEGYIGGVVASIALGAGFGSLISVVGPLHGLVVGAIIGVLGPMGDLAASLAKREIGVKDSSGLLPGHGGMLDRLDAILFGAPFVLFYLRAVVF